MRDNTRISLMAAGLIRDPEGLCSMKFRADYETVDIDYSTLKPGDIVREGGRTIVITDVGKRCYPDCHLFQTGRTCQLKKNCAFGRDAE